MSCCFNSFLLAFLLVCGILHAQTPAYKHYDVSNGLPSNEVYSIKQDRKGFLWLGTDAGLTRFNGNAFKIFTTPQLNGISVTGISEDTQGRIWCNNFSGQVLYVQQDSMHIYKPWDKYYKTQLIEITLDHKDRLFVSNARNLIYRFNITQNKIKAFGDANQEYQSIGCMHNGDILYTNVANGKIYRIKDDQTSIVRLKTNSSININDSALNAFVFFPSQQHKSTYAFQRQNPTDQFSSIFSYQNNALIVHPITTYLRQFKIFPISMLDDDEGNIFIGTIKGCYWFTYNATGVIQFEQVLFENRSVSNILKDKEGSYWFTTLKNGVYQIPNLNIRYFSEQQLNVPLNTLGAITNDNKRLLYVSTNSPKVLVINTTTNTKVSEILTTEERDAQAFEYDTLNNRLLYYKNTFSYWNNGQIANIPYVFSAVKDYFVRKDGVVFAAGTSLQIAYKPTQKATVAKEFNLLPVQYATPVKIPADWKIGYIFRQRTKAVWYSEKYKILWSANADGTIYIKDKVVYQLTDNKAKQKIIASTFYELPDGKIVIGTLENGLYIVEGETIIQHLTTTDGLLSDNIRKIRGESSILWIVSNKGIQKYNLHKKDWVNITYNNGLISPEVYDVAIVQNKVYASTAAGLQFFPTNIQTINAIPPYVGIRSFVTTSNVYANNANIHLAADENYITIYLDGVSLKGKSGYYYKYRIVGFDTSWQIQDAGNNIVRLNAMPSGNYVFEVFCINEDGISSKAVTQRFTVAKPWWLQWWFLLLAISALVFMAVQVTKKYFTRKSNKIKEALEQSKMQEELRQSQLASLKAQMNPHFMFNALNSIQEFILLNEKKQANMYMGKFADLMRLTLDQSNKESITLEEELKVLHLYLELEALRFEDKIQYHIQVDNITSTASVSMPAMLIQPYVENAIKHGLMHKQGDKNLLIRFYVNNNELHCIVKDNGIGRKRATELKEMRQKKYTSFSTGATQKRLSLLNYNKPQTISVNYEDHESENGMSAGTTVHIVIPIQSTSYSNSQNE